MPYLEEALRVLFANKIRSILTMIGLIIGVAAVIAIQTLGASMSGAVNGAIGGLADNTFFVQPNPTQPDFQKALFKQTDLAELATLPNVSAVVPLLGTNDLIRHAHNQARYFITGDAATPFNNTDLQAGRRINDDDIRRMAQVAVITNKAYVKLFPNGEDALGQTLYVGPHRYTIVGVLAAPKSGLLNAQFGGDVYAPYTTLIGQYMRGQKIAAVRLVVNDAKQIDETELLVIQKMRALRSDSNLEYSSVDRAQITKGINGIFGAMTLVVAFIAAVSLLVAGIGVMNIMLVSVT